MKIATISLFFFFTLMPLVSHGGDKIEHGQLEHGQPGHLSAVESLSPRLRELLTQEMQALQQGMISIIPAYVSGNWAEIERVAVKMKDSYILKQRLSDEQVTELHTLLPESFLQLDERFHYLSGMLNHAAKNRKAELVGFYFSRLGESCVNCHSQFAIHRFPAFAAENIIPGRHNH